MDNTIIEIKNRNQVIGEAFYLTSEEISVDLVINSQDVKGKRLFKEKLISLKIKAKDIIDFEELRNINWSECINKIEAKLYSIIIKKLKEQDYDLNLQNVDFR
jgi:hypothetical protein